jgi:hypothetical protein
MTRPKISISFEPSAELKFVCRRTHCRAKPIVGRPSDCGAMMVKFLLWCILFVFCWPLALAALVLYPLVWLLLLPFRIIGIAVDGVLQLVAGIVLLPARLLRAI